MKDARACRACHHLTRKDECPVCHERDLTKDWQGLVIIIDPKRSRLSQEMGIDAAGPYALKVR